MSLTVTPEPTVDTAIDPALLCLLAAAERGEETPSICLLTGSWMVQGQPARSGDFGRLSGQAWWGQLAATRDVKKFRGTEDEKVAMIRQKLNPLLATIIAWESPGIVPVLTLVRCVIGGGVGATFEMPTLRVPLSSVQAWWVTEFSVNQPKGGGMVGVGMSF